MNQTSIFIFLLVNYFLFVVRPATIEIKNNCPYPVWPGILSGYGTSDLTGVEVIPRAIATFTTSTQWSGQVWGRLGCLNDTGKLVCASGDCGSGDVPCNGAGATPPSTLVEFNLSPPGEDKDFYDVSTVKGFNMPVIVAPQGGFGCSATSCLADINAKCPADLALKDAKGGIIGCKSGCAAFNKPEYCCTPPFETAETCKPTNYSQFFKDLCPIAVSYAFDKQYTNFACARAKSYLITFCP